MSLHPHNDRGCAVAATELGLMAGQTVLKELCLAAAHWQVDLVTLGLNMFTQGVNPNLDFSNINNLIETAEFATNYRFTNVIPMPEN